MRLPACLSIVAVGVAAAGAAAAQMMGPMAPMMMTPQPPVGATYGAGADAAAVPSRRERYEAKIVELKAKMDRLTAADGGQLSAQHRAGLQKELDDLNRRFGLKPAAG
jgi:hypothetical protein